MTDGFIRAWGSRGNGDGEFDTPKGIAIGVSGRVYVADSCNDRIQCFDAETGTFLYKWGRLGKGDDEFSKPMGLAIDSCEEQKETLKRAMCVVPELASLPPGLLPMCVAYAVDECLYVADFGNNRVKVFQSN